LPTSDIKEVIFAQGHKNIRATHKTTLEFTTDRHLTKKGDCIIALAANKASADLSAAFKKNLRNSQAHLILLIEAGGISEQVEAQGDSKLILANSTDMVIRKSGYICNRTLAVHADKAAQDLSRNLVEKLKNPRQTVKITLKVHI
jgi:hypothetical protein